MREADILASLNHENIVPFYGLYANNENPQQLFLVTKLATLGNSLEYLAENRHHAPLIVRTSVIDKSILLTLLDCRRD
jgi:serine/threonine protein kinase